MYIVHRSKLFSQHILTAKLVNFILVCYRIGLQRGAIERWQATGLNTSLQLLPEILQSGGYKTHLVSKIAAASQ